MSRLSQSLSTSTVQFAITHSSDEIDWDLVDRANYPAESFGGEPAGLGFGTCRKIVETLGGAAGVQRDEDGTVTLWINLDVEDLAPHWRGRRAHGRLLQESVASSLGPVLDLSLGGMRVQTARPPADPVELTLSDEEEEIELRASVAWIKRRGFGKHEVGLRFIDVTPDQATRLGRLATRNRIRQVFEAA